MVEKKGLQWLQSLHTEKYLCAQLIYHGLIMNIPSVNANLTNLI